MNFNFPFSGSTDISFGVGVAGTSTEPSMVRLVLSRGSTSLSFSAKRDGDVWSSTIENPGATFGAGDIDLCIEVVLNGRVFSPFKGRAVIAPAVKQEEPMPEISIHFPQEAPPSVQEQAPVIPPLQTDAIRSLMQVIDSLTKKVE